MEVPRRDAQESLPNMLVEDRRPLLSFLDGSGLQATHRLEKPETYLGRGHSADVQITGGGVSRMHARIAYANFHQPTEGPECVLSDCSSRNGTFLNGRRVVDPVTLAHGDKILIDNTLVVFRVPDPTDPVSNQSLQRIITIDTLTGLMNHEFMDIRSHREIDRSTRYGRPLALLLVVIDNFPALLASKGRVTADGVLRKAARLLAGEIRTFDMAARTSADCFSLLLPETDAEGAFVLAERIRGDIESHPFEGVDGPLAITVSIGIAGMGVGFAGGLQGLTSAAQQALEETREKGPGRIATAG